MILRRAWYVYDAMPIYRCSLKSKENNYKYQLISAKTCL